MQDVKKINVKTSCTCDANDYLYTYIKKTNHVYTAKISLNPDDASSSFVC